jgi:hypothetical protein
MSFTTRVSLLAGTAALSLTGVSQAAGDDMAQRLAAAEAKIAAMEAASNQNWLTEQRANEIKGLVQDVLADADTRASLLQSGATAGYDKGFIVGSTDGNWLLRINFLMQQRFYWNHASDDTVLTPGVIPDTNVYGFENTNSVLMLSGHVVNPSWFYRVDVNFGSPGDYGFDPARSSNNPPGAGFASGGPHTLNAYIGHDCGNGWKAMVGTMKLPLLREELVEDQYQLTVERSNLNYFFTGGYSDGVQIAYEGDKFHVMGMFSDGARMGQTSFYGGPAATTAPLFHSAYALTGRFEWLAQGTWGQFADFTNANGGENGILVGGAVHYQKDESGLAFVGPGTQKTLILTGDVSAEFGQFNLYGAVVWSDISDAFGVVGPPSVDTNPWGFIVQGGWHFNDSWELFARYEWLDYDTPTGVLAVSGSSPENLSIITVGVNKYFAGHNAKWTTDIAWSTNSLDLTSAGIAPAGFNMSPAAVTGFRPDDGNEDGQFVFRSQLQILF